jgi:hypothetical protein
MATPVRILWLAATLLALPARVPANSLISLELPGIEGEAGPPAPAGSIALESFAHGADSFTAIKAVDASSPELLRAAAEGTLFATARVEVFDTEVVPTQPIEIYLFGDVLITAFVSMPSSGPIPYEQLTLAFSTVVPEAAGCLLVLTGGLVLGAVRRQRRAQPLPVGSGPRFERDQAAELPAPLSGRAPAALGLRVGDHPALHHHRRPVVLSLNSSAPSSR